jgi:hypothetical protein
MYDTDVRKAVWMIARQAARRIWRDPERAGTMLVRLWDRAAA